MRYAYFETQQTTRASQRNASLLFILDILFVSVFVQSWEWGKYTYLISNTMFLLLIFILANVYIDVNAHVSSSTLLLDLFSHLRNGLEKVCNESVIRDLENRRFSVLVDANNRLGVLHASQVLENARFGMSIVEGRSQKKC